MFLKKTKKRVRKVFESALRFVQRKIYLRIKFKLTNKAASQQEQPTKLPHKRRGVFMNTPRMQGKIKFFKHDQGFGFITSPVQGGKDIFIHAKELPQGTKVDKGDTVAFDTKEAPKGLMAINAELIEKAPQQERQPRREREREAHY